MTDLQMFLNTSPSKQKTYCVLSRTDGVSFLKTTHCHATHAHTMCLFRASASLLFSHVFLFSHVQACAYECVLITHTVKVQTGKSRLLILMESWQTACPTALHEHDAM